MIGRTLKQVCCNTLYFAEQHSCMDAIHSRVSSVTGPPPTTAQIVVAPAVQHLAHQAGHSNSLTERIRPAPTLCPARNEYEILQILMGDCREKLAAYPQVRTRLHSLLPHNAQNRYVPSQKRWHAPALFYGIP